MQISKYFYLITLVNDVAHILYFYKLDVFIINLSSFVFEKLFYGVGKH